MHHDTEQYERYGACRQKSFPFQVVSIVLIGGTGEGSFVQSDFILEQQTAQIVISVALN